ncbi:hypothetical protein [Candidatus Solincola tengchongensis]|uniref:hypothetical protein n=1 Tax=Candidatus Solincola tengchongensis TaxID=2900693 RepID=UPI00257EDB40|nr:hypothetical protein [Candidatus Solincola tengchongensis]
MKALKFLLGLTVAISLAATGGMLLKVIGVQRGMGEKQTGLLDEVRAQERGVRDILPAFRPTEEMAEKTEAMLADLQALVEVVSEMNDLVRKANELQGTTADLLDRNNLGVGFLGFRIASSKSPLAEVGGKTAITLQYINRTLAALQDMVNGLRASNACASDIADMMEGKYK